MTADKKIWAILRGLFESFSQRDESGLESDMDPDCTVWDVFEPELIVGSDEREAFPQSDRQQSPARGTLSWELEPLNLDVIGDLAIARYYLHFTYQPPHPTQGRVRITDKHQNKSGVWKIIHHHEGITPGGPPDFEDQH
jgi:ketosteroid isomerase-like protein